MSIYDPNWVSTETTWQPFAKEPRLELSDGNGWQLKWLYHVPMLMMIIIIIGGHGRKENGQANEFIRSFRRVFSADVRQGSEIQPKTRRRSSLERNILFRSTKTSHKSWSLYQLIAFMWQRHVQGKWRELLFHHSMRILRSLIYKPRLIAWEYIYLQM